MEVKNLVEMLSKLDQELEIEIRDDEGYWCAIDKVEKIEFDDNEGKHREWYQLSYN